jgi:Derlin-2/3
VWYFFSDVYPPLHNGHRPFDPPAWWTRLFEGRGETEAVPVEQDIAAAAAGEVR